MAEELRIILTEAGPTSTGPAGSGMPPPPGTPSSGGGDSHDSLRDVLDRLAAAAEEMGGKKAGGPKESGPKGVGFGKAFGDALDQLEGKVRAAGDAMAGVASNQPGSAIKSVMSGLADVASACGPVGMAVGAVTKVAIAAADAVGQMVDAFVERGRQLKQFSPELSAANAISDARKLMADIREAQQLGSELSKLTTAQADLDITMREIWLPLKKMFLEQLVPFLEYCTEVLRDIGPTIVGMSIAQKNMARDLWALVKGDTEPLKQTAREIAVAMNKLEEALRPKGGEEWMNVIKDQLKLLQQNVQQPGVVPRPDPMGGKLNIPMFQGLL